METLGLSYEFSIGSVRAREKSLLTGTDIEQLVSCKNEAELAAMLADKDFGSGSTVDELLAERTAKVWEYLRSVAPDFEIFSPFLIQNDIHNIKVVLKGTMSARKYAHLLLTPGTIDTDVIVEAVENRKPGLLPEWVSAETDRAYELLSQKGDARESDAAIDAAAMREMLRLSEQSGSGFLVTYFRNLVFYNNVKIAVRSMRTRVSREFLEDALCEVEDFRKKTVIEATLKGSLIDELSKFSEYDCKSAMEEYKKSPSDFERFVDNRLILIARESCKRASEGAEPILGYYLGTEAEKKVIHIIASGIRTGAGEDKLRERLREIYG